MNSYKLLISTLFIAASISGQNISDGVPYLPDPPADHENDGSNSGSSSNRDDYLLDFNMEIIYAIMKILQIKVKIVMESELGIKSSSTQEILDILDVLNSKQYLTGDGSGSKRIIEGKEKMFSEREIQIIHENYVPTQYPQICGKFIPELSICDMLFNVGMKKTREMLNGKN